MCEDKNSCITINCGCCGDGKMPAQPGTLRYMQLEADRQSIITAGKKIYFNNKSFGDFELTASGTVVLDPGVYLMFLNCQITASAKPAYVSLMLHDVVSNEDIEEYTCSRITPTHTANTSGSEGLGIIKITEKVELCINGFYVDGDPAIEDIYASILRIAELPTTEV